MVVVVMRVGREGVLQGRWCGAGWLCLVRPDVAGD